jgi:hypothetical protein
VAVINGKTVAVEHSVLQTTWAPLGANTTDTGSPEELSRFAYKSVQFTGTFTGPPTCTLEGSDDGVTYFTLNDVKGNAISVTAAGRYDLITTVRFIRPKAASGGSASVTCTLTSRSLGH